MRELPKKRFCREVSIIKGNDGYFLKYSTRRVFVERDWFTSIRFWPKMTCFSIFVRTVIDDTTAQVVLICNRDDRAVYNCFLDVQGLLQSSGWLINDFSHKRNETERNAFAEWKALLEDHREDVIKLINDNVDGGWNIMIANEKKEHIRLQKYSASGLYFISGVLFTM